MADSFWRQERGTGPLVTKLGPTGFLVDNVRHADGVLLWPDRAEGWLAPALDALTIEALEPLLAGLPQAEFVLIGTGSMMVQPPRALAMALDRRGLGLEAMDSRAAARAWAVLRAEDRQVVAALWPLR